MKTRVIVLLLLSSTAFCQIVSTDSANTHSRAEGNVPVRYDSVREVAHGTTAPLRELATRYSLEDHGFKLEVEDDLPTGPTREYAIQADAVLQTQATAPLSALVGFSFQGLSTNGSYPPDPNGAVGISQYVEVVNTSLAVYDKTTGAVDLGPVFTNALWSGLNGTACQLLDDGDATVAFDKEAQRWVVQQFVSVAPYYDCVAVSTTDDATGSWNAYAFTFNWGSTYFADYPKLGTWPVAYSGFPQGVYLLSVDIFVGNPGPYNGPDVCFMDRGAMLAGTSATQSQCAGLSPAFNPLIPSDLDGSLGPPPGEPGFFMTWDPNGAQVDMVKLTPCFPTCSTVTALAFSAPAFTPYFAIAGHGSNCIFNGSTRNGPAQCDIPEASGDGTYLDSLSDKPMYRLAYRNFGSHESLVFNHTVLGLISGAEFAAIRWYEIQDPNGAPFVAQAGTFAPNYHWRWMGSTAMDRVGDQALGYSMSETQITGYPGPIIAITGRTPSDPPGTMEDENLVITSAGYQNSGNSRWGDYSSLQVDPVDDCTFWYTQEYMPYSGPVAWSTSVINFRFPNCVPASTTTLGSSINPSTVAQSVTFTANVASNGSSVATGSVTFIDGSTAMGTGTMNNAGTATYTTSGLSVGQHSITAAYEGDSNTGASTSTELTQIVNIAVTTTTLVSGANPATSSSSVTFTATVTANAPITPTGTVTFSDRSHPLGTGTLSNVGIATYTTSSLAAGLHSITAAYAGDANNGASASAMLTQTMNGDFALTSTPTSATIAAGSSANYKVSVTPQVFFGSAISLSCSGLPAAASCTFSPATVTPNSTAATSNLVISNAQAGVLAPPEYRQQFPLFFASLLVLPMVLSAVMLGKPMRAKLQGYILIYLLLAFCVLQLGCGGGNSNPTPPPPTTYTVTVTGTAGAVKHSTTVMLTIQ